MRNENQTILIKNLSNSRKYKALFYVVEKMKIICNYIKLSK